MVEPDGVEAQPVWRMEGGAPELTYMAYERFTETVLTPDGNSVGYAP
jgi:hypothetical protein